MRRVRAPLAILTIMLISLLVAGPASAGGPTSVLLVSGTGQTASLYTGTADYAELAELVGASEITGAATMAATSGTSHASGTAVTLTWLIHDVDAWRVDRIYFEADGGPWISTQSTAGEAGKIWDSPIVWHVAARGKVLEALLNRLGVSPYPSGNAALGGSSAGGGAGTDIAQPATTAAAQLGKPMTRGADVWLPGSAGLVWGLAGLALGVALTVAGMRMFPNSRTATGQPATTEPAEDGPAHVGADPHGPDSELNWSLTDKRSWPSQRR